MEEHVAILQNLEYVAYQGSYLVAILEDSRHIELLRGL